MAILHYFQVIYTPSEDLWLRLSNNYTLESTSPVLGEILTVLGLNGDHTIYTRGEYAQEDKNYIQ